MTDTLHVRTVELELLRSGPAHNQLLSPLTPYLAICGDSPAGVVHVPYEHSEFEQRLNDLRYTGASDDRLAQLRATGADVARMLASVPGLAGAVASDMASPPGMVHLRITVSASELALLPFELAKVPTTADGASEAWLALRTNPPVCVTRRVRTVPTGRDPWPAQARILFVAADPLEIPFDAHRRALAEAIAPLRYPGEDDAVAESPRHTHYGHLLTIVEDASLDDVIAACRARAYTHVHILAHGAVDLSSRRRPFGIRLRAPGGGADIVSGERFSSALQHVDASGVHRPFAVTIASCDSGLVTDVVEATSAASFAHTLHQSGIPLVVGSQFPLTKDGSVTVVERLYGGLTRGDDPRVLIQQVRSDLHTRHGASSHDWASLVVYEALPADVPEQAEQMSYTHAKRRVDVALRRLALVSPERDDHAAPAGSDERAALQRQVMDAVDGLPRGGAYAVECDGLRASALKCLAESAYREAKTLDDTPALERSCEALEDALAAYSAAATRFLRNDTGVIQRAATLHWLLTQQLSLATVLRRGIDDDLWSTARLYAQLYLEHPETGERAWAHASLAELHLIRLAAASGSTDVDAPRVREHVTQFIAAARTARIGLSSTLQQFRRYEDWWADEAVERVLEGRRLADSPWHPWTTRDAVVAAARDARARIEPVVRREELTRAPRTPAARLTPTGLSHGVGAVALPVPPAPTGSAGPSGTAAHPPASESGPGQDRGSRARSETFFTIEMLPAQYGDCLWIEYGSDPHRPSRVLIDCGTRRTSSHLLAKIESLAEDARAVELFVLTHIDDDHIGGAIPFLQAEMGGLSIGGVWFNGYKHLGGLLSAVQGEQFSTLIDARRLPWNLHTGGAAIATAAAPPVFTLPGGLTLTVLSPTAAKLDTLRVRWEKELRARGMVPGEGVEADDLLGGDPHAQSTDVEALAALPFTSDDAPANGSSIALLAEFAGRRVLLAADAHPPVLEASIRTLLAARGLNRLPLDAFKVSHHGSHSNTSPALLQLIECPRYLISTNGQKFEHPHRTAISRILMNDGPRPHLYFNYLVPALNGVWARPDLQQKYDYKATYAEGTRGLTVAL